MRCGGVLLCVRVCNVMCGCVIVVLVLCVRDVMLYYGMVCGVVIWHSMWLCVVLRCGVLWYVMCMM